MIEYNWQKNIVNYVHIDDGALIGEITGTFTTTSSQICIMDIDEIPIEIIYELPNIKLDKPVKYQSSNYKNNKKAFGMR